VYYRVEAIRINETVNSQPQPSGRYINIQVSSMCVNCIRCYSYRGVAFDQKSRTRIQKSYIIVIYIIYLLSCIYMYIIIIHSSYCWLGQLFLLVIFVWFDNYIMIMRLLFKHVFIILLYIYTYWFYFYYYCLF